MKKNLLSLTLILSLAGVFLNCTKPAEDPLAAADAARRGTPYAYAGNNVTITLPTNSTTLDGSQSKEVGGTITSYLWTKDTGPDSYTIVNPSSKITSVTNLVAGNYKFWLTVTDAKGQTAKDYVLVTVNPAPSTVPTLASISPSSGVVGTVVTIVGTNFDLTPSVSFNGVKAVVTISTATSITTTVPDGATSGTITVVTGGTALTSSTSFSVIQSSSGLTYFQGNMDNVTVSTSGSSLYFNGWDALKTHPYVEEFYINNIGGSAYANQKIVSDPSGTGRNSLQANVINDDPNTSGTTRAQMTLTLKDGVDLPVYHTSQRMYLGTDIPYIQNYSGSITWFELFEIWNKHVDTWDGDVAGSCRWNLSLFKDTGAGQPLYWVLKSEYMQPAAMSYKNVWRYNNTTTPIPFGKWFTLDMYMKRGEGTAGHMTVTITPDGGSPQVLFDFANTTIYPGHPEIQLKSWQSFKFYLDDVYLDWMSTNGKNLTVYYNDYTWWQN